MYSSRNFLSHLFYRQATGVWSWPGFSIDIVEVDWMHAADLRVTLYTLGNIVWEMIVELGGSYTSPTAALGKILTMIALIAKDLEVEPPLFDLTIGMVTAGASEAPKLKVKAGEARHLVPIVKDIVLKFFDTTSAHGRMRMDCVNALHLCYQEVNDWADESSTTLGRFGRQFCLMYSQLHLEAVRANPWSFKWRLYPKFHLFIHICEAGYNPRETWNYWDESTIGDCAKVCEGCHPAYLAVSPILKHRMIEYGLEREALQ